MTVSRFSDAVVYSVEEDTADHGVHAAGYGDVDFDVAGQTPHQINAIAEVGQRARVEHSVGVGIYNLNRFASSPGIPIQRVQGEEMKIAIGEIHVKVEGAAVPD